MFFFRHWNPSLKPAEAFWNLRSILPQPASNWHAASKVMRPKVTNALCNYSDLCREFSEVIGRFADHWGRCAHEYIYIQLWSYDIHINNHLKTSFLFACFAVELGFLKKSRHKGTFKEKQFSNRSNGAMSHWQPSQAWSCHAPGLFVMKKAKDSLNYIKMLWSYWKDIVNTQLLT